MGASGADSFTWPRIAGLPSSWNIGEVEPQRHREHGEEAEVMWASLFLAFFGPLWLKMYFRR